MPEITPPDRVRKLRRPVARSRWALLVPGLALFGGCLYGGREATDENVKAMLTRPYDQLPEQLREKAAPPGEKPQVPPAKDAAAKPAAPAIQTDVQTAAYMQGAPPGKAFQLHVPEAIPGSEAPLLTLPVEPAARAAELNKLYPPLPPLEAEVKPLPGPNGQPYTLSDFQRIAAENSPTLRQAASDVQAAKGNAWQARAYANPNVSLQAQPSNNGATSAALGFAVDQVVNTGGKQQMQVAAADKQYEIAKLALQRARSDLATSVRNAYYSLLVAKETMRVTRALSVMTDEVYRVQLAYTQNAGQSAAYEPAALRAQAWSARLAYTQSIATYVYAWKIMVQAIGQRQLPLSEVAGRIDALVPYYAYDKVLAHVLQKHTDMLTAITGIDVQKYNLKYAQVLPYVPNVDFNIGMFKDTALFPYGTYVTFTASAPLPIWDQNRGNILSAEAALARALEEPHRVELALTNTLATNYTNYMTNLKAVEFYRRYVLPDQVRAYRGTLLRRQVDVTAQFGDLVAAQQALASSVTTYLGLLGTLWSSVISVADMLQTDDLFQNAEVRDLPALPTDELEKLPPLPCCHPYGHSGAAPAGAGCPTPLPLPLSLPAPTPLPPATATMPSAPQPPAIPTPNTRPAAPPALPLPAASVPPVYSPQAAAALAPTALTPTYVPPAVPPSTPAPAYAPQATPPAPAYTPPTAQVLPYPSSAAPAPAYSPSAAPAPGYSPPSTPAPPYTPPAAPASMYAPPPAPAAPYTPPAASATMYAPLPAAAPMSANPAVPSANPWQTAGPTPVVQAGANLTTLQQAGPGIIPSVFPNH